jgi:hypothetical protein
LKGTISDKVDELFETYSINNHKLVHLIIYFVRLDKKFGPNLLLKTGQKPVSKLSSIHKKKINPVSLNDQSLGPALDTLVDPSGHVIYISFIPYSKKIKFLDNINSSAFLLRKDHRNRITYFDKDFNFYFFIDNYNTAILTVKLINKKTVFKIHYSMNGVVIKQLTDHMSDNN